MKKIPREDAMHHSRELDYMPPRERAVLKKLEWFRDQKLALMVHFGVYSQLGICESWPLSDGDAGWARRHYTWTRDPDAFRAQYFALNRSFQPLRFDPDEWAEQAARAGMRYLIFTTKHHDGFCLYDTRETNYKVTAPDCPFHENANANIALRLFDAFRARNLGIAAYFSKPDWHCPWYWAQGCEKPVGFDRNPTYDPMKQPRLWAEFRRFARAQMLELTRDLGPLDILWLDGGQVRPSNGQDLNMAEIARAAREITPNLLIADRTVGGPFENYITPEQAVPDQPIAAPWESCVTIGRGFAFSYDDVFKSPRELVRLLLDVVCKGGNLALGVGAQPDGRLPAGAMRSARGMGEWLDENGAAVYGTRACAPQRTGAWAEGPGPSLGFLKKGATVYVLHPLAEGELAPAKLLVPWHAPVARASRVSDGRPLAFSQDAEGLHLALPQDGPASPLALAIALD